MIYALYQPVLGKLVIPARTYVFSCRGTDLLHRILEIELK